VNARTETSSGFTLIELLVALVVLAMLSAMLVGTLRFAHLAASRGEAATDRIQQTETAMRLLRRQLEQATPLALNSTAQPSPFAFAGDQKNIVFLAPPAAALAMGGLQLMWFAIERNGNTTRLVLRWRDFDPREESWPPALDRDNGMNTLALGETPGDATFSYFGPPFGPGAAPNSASQWASDWSGAPALPTLIRLGFSGSAIPDLLVSPHQGGAAGIVAAGGVPRN
jgi:prepilin-type N-terminal cleavage/methylation domain-containing protein